MGGENATTSLEELEELLAVERIHTGRFTEWEKRATDPMARMVFRLAADKEANHIRWVEALLEIAKAGKLGKDPGVSKAELEYWVQDEDGEGESYRESAQRATEPWVKAVLEQIGNDETTNSQLLKTLLSHV